MGEKRGAKEALGGGSGPTEGGNQPAEEAREDAAQPGVKVTQQKQNSHLRFTSELNLKSFENLLA